MSISTNAPPLLPSPFFRTSYKPLLSSSLGHLGPFSSASGSSDQSYILNLVSLNLSSHYALSTSSPSNSVHVVDQGTLQLVQTLGGGGAPSQRQAQKSGQPQRGQTHEGGVTNLKAFDCFLGARKQGLLSCGKEGNAVIWDDRTREGEGGLRMIAPSAGNGKARALLCCDISPDGMTVAAGTELQSDDAIIVYWHVLSFIYQRGTRLTPVQPRRDPRNPSKPLRTHTSTHSDDITVLSFAPSGVTVHPAPSSEQSTPTSTTQPLLLLSASSDGLLGISNASEDDEDEAILVAANWGCSIGQAGWIENKGVWAGSDMETFSTWTPELDPVLDFDIRQPGVHSEAQAWVTDYLITCQASGGGSNPTPGAPSLKVFVGSNEGDASLISTKNPLATSGSKSRKRQLRGSEAPTQLPPWYLHATWSHGHVGVVRALLYAEQHNAVVTGGEDAKLHVWRDDSVFEGLWDDDGDVDMDSDDDEEDSMTPVEGMKSTSSPFNPRKRDLDSDGDDAMNEQEGKRLRR